MSIRKDIASLAPLDIVTLFEIDARPFGAASVLRWTSGTLEDGSTVQWQGNPYPPYPVTAEGFERNGQGTLPRPKLSASNIGGLLGAYMAEYGGALGAKVTRRRTLAKYLDGMPDADPNAAFPNEVYKIARKVSENAIEVVIELAVAFDVEGVMLPRRQVLAGTCQWAYRSEECGYSGGAVQTITGAPTSNLALDRCRKTLTACKARFGANGVLNTSAFPSSLLVSR